MHGQKSLFSFLFFTFAAPSTTMPTVLSAKRFDSTQRIGLVEACLHLQNEISQVQSQQINATSCNNKCSVLRFSTAQ